MRDSTRSAGAVGRSRRSEMERSSWPRLSRAQSSQTTLSQVHSPVNSRRAQCPLRPAEVGILQVKSDIRADVGMAPKISRAPTICSRSGAAASFTIEPAASRT